MLFDQKDGNVGGKKEDPTALPEDEERAEDMIGVELRKGDSLMFRGGILCLEDSYWLF